MDDLDNLDDLEDMDDLDGLDDLDDLEGVNHAIREYGNRSIDGRVKYFNKPEVKASKRTRDGKPFRLLRLLRLLHLTDLTIFRLVQREAYEVRI